MPWGTVQNNHAKNMGNNVTSTTFAVTSPVTLGNRLFLGSCLSGANSVVSVSDDLGNTWIGPHMRISDGTGDTTTWDTVVTVDGSMTITLTFASSIVAMTIWLAVAEFSGLTAATDSYLDGLSGTSSAGNTQASGQTQAAASDGELAIGWMSGTSGNPIFTPGSGWTTLDTQTSGGSTLIETQSTTVDTAVEATATTSGTVIWQAICLVFPLIAPEIPAQVKRAIQVS
jgi:hypothetical protein